jgi:hypothetical protein
MICPTFKLFKDFFLNNKEKSMSVSKEIFDAYLNGLNVSQRAEAKLSDTKAVWYGMGGARYIEVK